MTYLRILSATTAAIVALPFLALASTISLSPTTVQVTPGQTFMVTVTAVPSSGEKLYTVKADLSFNPAIVQVTNFSFASGWMALTQSGYDKTDNTNGELIKTGGYPSGMSAATVFGTVTFTAKAAGTATVQATGKSLALDQTSNNSLSGTQGSTVVTAAAVSTPAPAPKPASKPKASSQTSGHVSTSQVAAAAAATGTSTAKNKSQAVATTSSTSSVTTSTSTSSATGQVAAVGLAGNYWLYLIILFVIVLGGIWWYKRR